MKLLAEFKHILHDQEDEHVVIVRLVRIEGDVDTYQLEDSEKASVEEFIDEEIAKGTFMYRTMGYLNR